MKRLFLIVLNLSLGSNLAVASPMLAEKKICELTSPANPPGWQRNRIEFDLSLPTIDVFHIATLPDGSTQETRLLMVDERHASGYDIVLRFCDVTSGKTEAGLRFEYSCVKTPGSKIHSTHGLLEWDATTNQGTYLVEVQPSEDMRFDPSTFVFENCR